MSKNTKIEWADHTFNPWTGCTKISPACDNCYAEGWAKRSGLVKWGANEPRRITSPSNWKQPLRWNAQHDEFHAIHGRRQRVFCASLADVFDNAVDPYWRTALFDIIQATPNLDWLLLTKRIGNAWKMMADACGWSVASAKLPLHNVWLGATIANQPEADRDIFKLLNTPAAKHFLSMEPLLGPVDITVIDINGDCVIYPLRGTTQCVNDEYEPAPDLPALDWVIVGGESGPGARPMHPDWVRSMRDQCTAAGVPFMFKQWCEWKPISQMSESEDNALWRSRVKAKPGEDQSNLDDIHGKVCTGESTVMHLDGSVHHFLEPNAFPHGAMTMYRLGKKSAGRQLDGREWNEVPA